MSVAKPSLEFISNIKVQRSVSSTIPILKRLLKYHKPYLKFVILVLALAVVRSYLFTLEPVYTSQIIDQVIVNGNYDLLQGFIVRIIVAILGYVTVNYAIIYIQGFVAQSIVKDIRHDYYSAAQNKSFNFFDSASVGDLISRVTLDLQNVDMLLRTWIGIIANAVFTVVLGFNVMFSVNPTMSLITLIPISLIFFFTNRMAVLVMPLIRKNLLILGRLTAYVQQNIIGMKVVRIFQREKEMEDGFDQIEDVFIEDALAIGKVQSKYMSTPQAVMTLGMAMIYVYAGNLLASPESLLTIGQITLFTRLLMRLTMPLREFSNLEGSLINAASGLERVNEIIESYVSVKDRIDAKDIMISRGQVAFENVSFGYSKDRPVLKNLSFNVKSGEKIAILGATGSGKSSLIYLIPRFYDVDSGSILIDDIDIRDYNLSSLRRQVGLVLQDVFLFVGTIKDNIAFGRSEATMDEVITVAKHARIHDFIESLPEGYNTLVGERGVTLSGGQKQRLTIARTLLVNPKILILDDSLSFVDAKTEQEIQGAIDAAMKGRTSFIIAQRLSTIKNADRIMVLDNGEIAELGTHDELITQGGVYKRIYETQFLEKASDIISASEVK